MVWTSVMTQQAGTELLQGLSGLPPAFVPTAGQVHDSISSTGAALRGTAGPAAEAPDARIGAGLLVGVTGFALAASGTRKQCRHQKMPRRFFGSTPSAPAPVPKKEPASYKDFNDPWLGSADLDFDPLNLAVKGGIFDKGAKAVPETTYYNYRESEVKHGRFAMGAFLAIFAEAADRGALLNQLGLAGAEDTLDGTLGLDEVQLPVLLTGIGYQALAEYSLQRKEDDGDFLSVEYKKDRLPGDLGFDPLGLARQKPKEDVIGLHNVEINSGRLAMIGITSFLVREFIVKDL